MNTITKNQLTEAQLGKEVSLDRENSLIAVRKHGTWEYCHVQRGMAVAVRQTNGDEKEVARLLAMPDEQYLEDFV